MVFLLIFSTKFLDSVILTLYNFGANQREEYLLLRLFKTALEEEVMKKVDKISDIVSGNPMVIKMIVGFYKSGSGQIALRHSIYIRTQKYSRIRCLLKFIYSEKATKFCEISTNYLTGST